MFSKGMLEFHLYNKIIMQIRYQLKYINTCIFSQLNVTVYEVLAKRRGFIICMYHCLLTCF